MLARWRQAFELRYRKLTKYVQQRVETMPRPGSMRLVLFALGAFILVALMYLAQSSNAALIARDLRVKQLRIADVERENAQLRYEIAALASPSAIEQRAREQGLGPAKHVVYAEMPWIQPEPNELMPAFLPPVKSSAAPQTFEPDAPSTLEQLLALLGLESLADRVHAQTRGQE